MGSPELLVINTSPSPSGGGLNFVKGVSELPMDVIIKAKNRNWPNYYNTFPEIKRTHSVSPKIGISVQFYIHIGYIGMFVHRFFAYFLT
jgi:hypothetical protein